MFIYKREVTRTLWENYSPSETRTVNGKEPYIKGKAKDRKQSRSTQTQKEFVRLFTWPALLQDPARKGTFPHPDLNWELFRTL